MSVPDLTEWIVIGDRDCHLSGAYVMPSKRVRNKWCFGYGFLGMQAVDFDTAELAKETAIKFVHEHEKLPEPSPHHEVFMGGKYSFGYGFEGMQAGDFDTSDLAKEAAIKFVHKREKLPEPSPHHELFVVGSRDRSPHSVIQQALEMLKRRK